MMVLSQPIPRDKLPEDTPVFNSVITCRIKEGKDLFKFEARHCLDGQNMKQCKHINFSYSPTIVYPGCRMLLVIAAIKGLILKMLDAKNCFQNDVIEPDQHLFTNASPST